MRTERPPSILSRSRFPEIVQADPRSLAVFRIVLGLHLIVDLATRASDLTAHYTDAGILPRANMLHFGRLTLPLHRWSGGAPWEALLFVLAGVAAAMLTVGYRTRLATVVSWLMILSLHDRNPIILSGGDGLFRILLFWGMFVPLGACWSMDSARGAVPEGEGNRPVASVAVAMLFVQLASMYLFTGLLKVRETVWQNGSALGIALHVYDKTTALGTWILRAPSLVRALSYVTLIVEIVGPILLFIPDRPRLRIGVILALGALQLGISLFMSIGNFQSVSVVWMLPMLPSWIWDRPAVKKATDRLGALFPSRARAAAPTVETSLSRSLQLAFTGVAAAVGLVIFYGNVASVLVPNGQEVPGRPERFTYPLGLDQRWTMFCDPTRMTGWMVAPIREEDGTLVDVITGKRSRLAEKPELPSELYGTWRWRSFVTLTLWRANGTRYVGDYANYLCRTWNGAHRGGERAKELEVVFMRQMLGHDDGAPGRVERVNLWKGPCPAGS